MKKPDYLSKIDDVARQHSTIKSFDQQVVESWNNFEDLASKLEPRYDILNPRIPGGFITMTTEFINLLYQNNDSSWEADVEQIREKNKAYGESWCKRGGTGAYHALARKGDRIIEITSEFGSLALARKSTKYSESIDDTIGDLRRYLILVVAWYAAMPTEEKRQPTPTEMFKKLNENITRAADGPIVGLQATQLIIDDPEPPPVKPCPECKHPSTAHDEDGCNELNPETGVVCSCSRRGHG